MTIDIKDNVLDLINYGIIVDDVAAELYDVYLRDTKQYDKMDFGTPSYCANTSCRTAFSNGKTYSDLTKDEIKPFKVWCNTKRGYFNNCVGTDCYPYEIVGVASEREVMVRIMTYDLKADPTKLVRLIKRRKNGSWGMAGEGAYFYFTINPNFYQDPNF